MNRNTFKKQKVVQNGDSSCWESGNSLWENGNS